MSVLGNQLARVVRVRLGAALLLPTGCLMFLASTVLLAFAHDHLWQLLLAMALGGVGSGFTFSSLAVLMVPHVPQAETGSAMAFNQVLRYLGFTIGSALSVALMAAYGGGGHGFSATLLTVSSLFVVAAVGAVLLDRAARPAERLRHTDRVLLDIQLDARPDLAVDRARELTATGIAGLFTFEGPHDVFLPLAATAAAGVDTDLMTNVAIAMPRSPMHLANTAYDLQLMSGGRFRLGLGSQIKPHIEKRYGATWSPPAARMREIVLAVKAILGSWQDGTPLRFEGEHTRHTLMPPTFVPRPEPVRRPACPPRRPRPGDDPDRRRGRRRAAGDAVPQPPALPDRGRCRRSTRAWPARAVVVRTSRSCRRRSSRWAARTPRWRRPSVGVRGLLAFYGSTPAYVPVLEAEGWEGVQPELNRLSKTGDFGAMFELVTDEMLATLAVRGTPEECAAEIGRRFGDVADRVCCYFPGYEPPMEQIADLAGALRGCNAVLWAC